MDIVVTYLIDFLFLVGEKIKYPDIKKKFGTQQNPHPNVQHLMISAENFTGLPSALYVPDTALSQLDAKEHGSWHFWLEEGGHIKRYVVICRSCLLKQDQIGVMGKDREIGNWQKPTQFKVLNSQSMFLQDDLIPDLLQRWMLGTHAKNLQGKKVNLVPQVCGIRSECSQEGLILMLQHLNRCLKLKGELYYMSGPD